MTDIKPVDHRARAFRDTSGPLAARKLFERENQIGMQAARIDAQKPSRILGLLRVDIEGQPGRDRFRRELRGGKIDRDDCRNPLAGRFRPLDGGVEILPQFAQQMAHRGKDQLVLAAEIMMRERRRNARLMRDLRNRHVQRAALSDSAYGSVDQFAPP